MIKSSVTIVFLLICTLTSCNYFNKHKKSDLQDVTEVNKKDTLNYVKNRERLEAKGIYSYLSRDTFYIISKRDSLIIKRNLKLPDNNPEFIRKIYEMYDVEYERKKNYLFVSLYFGDATPYKSFLVDLKSKVIIVENDFYQTYLGHSNNGLYFLFEGGTSGSVREFAIFSSENKLLRKSAYYSSVNDTNQLKWEGNKIYYYNDIQESYLVPDSISKITEQYIYVQKYEWKDNNNYALNEFKETLIE